MQFRMVHRTRNIQTKDLLVLPQSLETNIGVVSLLGRNHRGVKQRNSYSTQYDVLYCKTCRRFGRTYALLVQSRKVKQVRNQRNEQATRTPCITQKFLFVICLLFDLDDGACPPKRLFQNQIPSHDHENLR